jgi:hypothetical protein
MLFRNHKHAVDTSLFDPEHDMDLVALINNARTEGEMQRVAHMSRARMKARRAAIQRGNTNGRRSLVSRRRRTVAA